MIVCFLSSSCCLMIETRFIKLTRKHQSLLFIFFSFFLSKFLTPKSYIQSKMYGFYVFFISLVFFYTDTDAGGICLKIQNKLKTKHEPCLLSNCFFTQFPFLDALLLNSLITSSSLYSVRSNLFKKYLSLQGGFRLFTFFFKKKRLPHLLRLFALAHN